jgi:hypothetical protein
MFLRNSEQAICFDLLETLSRAKEFPPHTRKSFPTPFLHNQRRGKNRIRKNKMRRERERGEERKEGKNERRRKRGKEGEGGNKRRE